ncbi:MAG: translocation/assembly module TamB domain-containing protein, partial [Gloeobacteraceae cyanobacterium ES-bin-144]|nr:translocation/assembly module TamB domain-containing protein [Verrucomicrobiales bacterium]
LLENIEAADWKVPQLHLDLNLTEIHSSLVANGQALGSDFSINADAPINRTNGRFVFNRIDGSFSIADAAKVITNLAAKTNAIDPAVTVPPSQSNGSFSATLNGNKIAAAEMNLILKPLDPKLASSIAAKANWQPEKPLALALEAGGLNLDAAYDLQNASYEGGMKLDHFNSARIEPWLAVVKTKLGGVIDLTGSWKGNGEVKPNKHRGNLVLADAAWMRTDLPAVNASGEIAYDFPSSFTTKSLVMKSNKQTISLDAKLSESLLELTNLRWLDGSVEMAGGSAKLPVPEDLSKWREMISNEKKPLDVSIESKVLSLALLKDWLPAAAKLDRKSTGQLSLRISGTYAEPELLAQMELKNLRSPEQPKLPPADLKITLSGKNARLSIDANATTPTYPPAVMTASMPFRPAVWTENPDSITQEEITARLDLPRIDLSKFSTLLAFAQKLTGILTGNVIVAGQLGKPTVKGSLDLIGGSIELKNKTIPTIGGVTASVDMALDKIMLKSLKATMAGGTLQAGGTLGITQGKSSNLDFKIIGDHLPLVRNDLMIVRANANLRLTGSFDKAAVSGSVGIVDSLFYRDIELLPIGSPFVAPSAAELPRLDSAAAPTAAIPAPFHDWSLNVLVSTVNPVLIRGNFAKGSAEGRIKIGGTIGKPAPDGEVKISDLQASLPFSTLKVQKGFVRFAPATGFDPILDIKGTAEPRPYRVNVYAYGRASAPHLVLTSSPPLPPNEIMTLLATGTTTAGLEDPRMASSRAMQLLIEEMRRGRFLIGKRLRPLLGLLDRVDFSLADSDPYSGSAYSSATISITDRWFVTAGMGENGNSRILGIWRLSFR